MTLKFLVPLVVILQLVVGFDVADDVKGAQEFAFGLFKSEYNKAENTVFSPFSIRVLLSILYQSSTGTTETELRNKVFFGDKTSTFTTQEGLYKSFWTNPSLKLANKIYLTKGGVLKSDFSKVVRSFDSEIEQVDFELKDEVAGKMNSFVEEKTNGLIKNLVSKDLITPDTALFLINTLYFKANWMSQFSADDVKLMNFTNYKGETKPISFMHQFGYFQFAELASIDASMISLLYEDDTNMEFLVVLPHSGSTIESVLNKFTTDTLSEFQKNSRETGMFYYMPVFETESSFDVKTALKKFGINALFNNGELDMVENLPKQMVDEAKQKTKIIVNTEGTEAASATFIKAIPETIWPSVYVDRPFFYMILSKDNKIPLFVGHFSE